MSKVFWIPVGVTIFAMAAVGVSAIGFAIGDRSEPIAFEDARALESSVPQGGTLWIEFDVYRTRICTAISRRFLVDSQGQMHNVAVYTIGQARKLGSDTYKRSIDIPQSAALGPATYRITIDFYCNLIQRFGWPVTMESPPIKFEITPATCVVPFQVPDPAKFSFLDEFG